MDQSVASLLVGRTLVGRYEIQELIGRGGMSVVYRATDRRLGRPVAVKVIAFPPGTSDEHEELRERLRREASAAASIPTHPNVVQVYDHGTDPDLGVDFIAMELLRGRDLKELLRAGRRPLAESIRILSEAARGVAAGHRVGIVHRDVKPANIILTPEEGAERVKILDFGIAKALEAAAGDDLTRTGFAPHSPAYASPEQLEPDTPLTAASDVYQLGLIGYELLAGQRPYDEATYLRIRSGEDVGVPDRGGWRELPANVRAVIERALARDPARRYPDAAAFAQALAGAEDDSTAFLPDHAVGPGPSHGTVPAGRPVAMKRWRLPTPGALKIGAAALVAVIALWAILGRGDGAGPTATARPDAEAMALEEEFRELQLQAHDNLEREASPAEGEQAAAAVDRTIKELTRAWVDGDIERHISFYGDRVRFYGSRVPRSRVARDRAETLVRYPARTITLNRTAIEFPEEGEARVLVDKTWSFSGDDARWEGAARQEFLLEQQDGRWRVVGERNVEVYRSNRDS